MTNDEYERLADEFYRDTGMMAPGKDQPAALGGEPYGVRVEAWQQWLKRRRSVAHEAFDNQNESSR